MHGHTALLPELHALAKRHGARLMIDEAHSVGVLGATGRGLEEKFNMPGSIDILMSTFSKAPGAMGGYVCASKDVVQYLRFYARASMFTASLPASICAGLSEAYRSCRLNPNIESGCGTTRGDSIKGCATSVTRWNLSRVRF